jgi:hypothetical protein
MEDYDFTLNPYSGCSWMYLLLCRFSRDKDKMDNWANG